MDTATDMDEVIIRSEAMNTNWELKSAFAPAKRSLLWGVLGLCLGHFVIRLLAAFGVMEPLSTTTLILALSVPVLLWLGHYRWQTHQAECAWIADVPGRAYQAFISGYVAHIDERDAYVVVLETTHPAIAPRFVIAQFETAGINKVGTPFIYRMWLNGSELTSEILPDPTLSRLDVWLHRVRRALGMYVPAIV